MDTYLVMLLVTTEQEQAIRYLYEEREWRYVKTCTRPPVKEELDYMYGNFGAQKTTDGSFRGLQSYLHTSYLDHTAAQPCLPGASFARIPAPTYGLHDLNKNQSHLFLAAGGADVGGLDLHVSPTCSASGSSSEMPYENSPALDSMGCISKSLTILDNMDTAQYSERIETEQTSTQHLPKESLNNDPCTVTKVATTSVIHDSAELVALQNIPVSIQSPSPEAGIKQIVSSFSPGKDSHKEDNDMISDKGTNETIKSKQTDIADGQPALTSPNHFPTRQLNHVNNQCSIIESKTKTFLTSIERMLKQELQDMNNLNHLMEAITDIQNEVCSLIHSEVGTENIIQDATQKNAEFTRKDFASNERQVAEGLEESTVDNEASTASEHIVLHCLKDCGMGQQADLDACVSQVVIVDGSSFLNNTTDPIHQSGSSKIHVGPVLEPNLKHCKDDSVNIKPEISRTRKYSWAVNRNIRMHGCHRKCREIPADLDASGYSVEEKGYFCADCMFVFKTKKQLQLHKELKAGLCSPECVYCDKDNFKDIFQCDRCPKCFRTKKMLEKHMLRHTLQHYQCDICEYGSYTPTELKEHLQSNHAKESKMIHLCDLCGARFNEKKVLNAHRKYVHTNERPEKCHTCGSGFKTKSQLKNHLIKHKKLEEVNLSCEICGKMFMRMATLKDHLRRHSKEFVVFCPQCGKGFYRKYCLEEHMRCHTGSKPYECDICLYKCALKGNLLKHMKIHSKESE